MRRAITGLAVVAGVAGWMFGSWFSMDSLAIGAQAAPPAIEDAQGHMGPDDFGMGRGKHGMKHGERGFHKFLKKLGLSEAQQQEVQAIRNEERANIRPLVEKMKEARKQLREQTRSGAFDEGQVRAIAKGQADTMTELIVARTRMHSRIFDVLTPEQRAKAEKMIEARRDARAHHGKGHKRNAQ